MSPGNIPAIAEERPSLMVIATTEQDQQRMRTTPVVTATAQLIPIEYHEMRVKPGSERLDMVRGISIGIRRAIEMGACWAYSQSDWVWADGALYRLMDLATSHKAVLGNNTRVDAMSGESYLKQFRSNSLIAVPTRALEYLMLNHPHAEERACEVTGSTVPSKPSKLIMVSPNRNCAVVRSHDRCEAAINFKKVPPAVASKYVTEYAGHGNDFQSAEGIIVENLENVAVVKSTTEVAVIDISEPFDVSHRKAISFQPNALNQALLETVSRYQQNEWVTHHARYYATLPFLVAPTNDPEFCRRVIDETQDVFTRATALVFARSPAAKRNARLLRSLALLPRWHPRRLVMGVVNRGRRRFLPPSSKPRD